MSERCPFALGREIEAAFGEINGPRELMPVEIQLRQKEVTFGKTRVAADGRFVGLELRVAIAESFIQLSQIELRHVAVRMLIDLRSILGDGAIHVAALLRGKRKIEVRQW